MNYLANSYTKLCQSRENGDMRRLGFPVYDCPWEECELEVVPQCCDLPVCKGMISR